MTIRELVERAHRTAAEKGWHDEERSFGEVIALIHSELSEALEEYRKNVPVDAIYECEGSSKPEGIPIELADVIIRIADFCGEHGVDLEAAIVEKMGFNDGRPHRHGGKKL